MGTANVKTLKHGPSFHAARREAISSSSCLDCGHLITDHHRAGGGWHGGKAENWHGKRSHCIGNNDTCPCRDFRQPHETRFGIVVP
jgi:hypothetical protein